MHVNPCDAIDIQQNSIMSDTLKLNMRLRSCCRAARDAPPANKRPHAWPLLHYDSPAWPPTIAPALLKLHSLQPSSASSGHIFLLSSLTPRSQARAPAHHVVGSRSPPGHFH